jgi:L-aspartate oxidase
VGDLIPGTGQEAPVPASRGAGSVARGRASSAVPRSPSGGGEGGRGGLDVLVVGSGVAGLSAAVHLAAAAAGLRVGLLTKAALAQATTRFAQGGVAAALGGDEDSTDLHLADTLAAGAGLCDVDAVRILVDEGPARVHGLIALGAVFDRLPGGELSRAREGGHSTARVLHAGGAATGAEVERALVEAVRRTATALLEGWFALELLVEQGRCSGVLALDPEGRLEQVRSRHVVLATGGAGQLFAVTTNPAEATGDGVAMALRAGAAVADVEFVQFHPTALHHPAVPRPLLSEALRGHGAVLRDARGERFVDELLPRDAVSRAMAARMAEQGVAHLWLDATGLERFAERFPTIWASLREAGLDPRTEWLPIAPAAHYLCGGVLTDLDGATSLPGLWACGEVACSGVHGANRLASNSLLEGMVFAPRVVEAILAGKEGPSATGAMRAVVESAEGGVPGVELPVAPELRAGRTEAALDLAGAFDLAAVFDFAKAREELQAAMTSGAGVLRDEASLSRTARTVGRLREALGRRAVPGDRGAPGANLVPPAAASLGSGLSSPAAGGHDRVSRPPLAREEAELANLVGLAGALVSSALVRAESRGAHTRLDHPDPDPSLKVRLVHRQGRGLPGS